MIVSFSSSINESSFKEEEKLIFFVMSVPMKLSFLKYPKANNTIIYFAQRLIRPVVCHFGDNVGYVYQL